MSQHFQERSDEQWWESKIDRLAERGFGKSVVKKSAPIISGYALKVFRTLCDSPNGWLLSAATNPVAGLQGRECDTEAPVVAEASCEYPRRVQPSVFHLFGAEQRGCFCRG
jgi:hypothetical protein